MGAETSTLAGDTEVVFDLSRLLSRILRPTPTGIDRVEMIYASSLLGRIPDRLVFAGKHPVGRYGRFDIAAVRQFLSYTSAMWRNGDRIDPRTLRLAAVRHLTALRPRRSPAPKGRRVFLQASPHGLEQPGHLDEILRRERAKFVCLIHDLIPITHPEFARPHAADAHVLRMEAVARCADGILVNSVATRDDLLRIVRTRLDQDRIRVALLGTELTLPIDASRADSVHTGRPYFVCVGTIEPRKNHLLLLNVWTRLAQKLGAATPELVLIGRRGWENEQVLDMLERSVVLHRLVREHGEMSDRQMQDTMANAIAILLPSFVEGFGMPVSEALASGVPVICADIPALREVGLDVPEYIDPIDGLGWLAMIARYAQPGSTARAAQLDRLAGWRAPTWREHMNIVLDLVDTV